MAGRMAFDLILYESEAQYRAFREQVPEEEEAISIGSSAVVREGRDLTMIAYGAMMRPVLKAAGKLEEKDGISAEVIDLLTLSPLDDRPFIQSVAKTGRAIPAVVFTEPQIAWCGLTETEATRTHQPIRVERFPWKYSGRALTMDATEGLTKIIADPETHRVRGVGIVGRDTEGLIAEGVLAVEMGALAEDLALSIHPHPTLSETEGEAAEMFTDSATHVLPKQH